MITVAIVVLAVVVVLAGSLLKDVTWSDKAKNLVVTVLSVIGGVVGVYATGGFNDATDVLTTAGLIYAASQLIYTFVFQGTALNSFLESKGVGSKKVDEPVVPAVDPAEHQDAQAAGDAAVAVVLADGLQE